MGDAREEAEKPWRRAELFETLAHPTRVRILRVLEKQPLSFADLKRVFGIESSGSARAKRLNSCLSISHQLFRDRTL